MFRYPGGKERLARKLLKDTPIPFVYINESINIDLNDLDDWTAEFWKILTSSENSVEAGDDPLMPTAQGRAA